MELALELAMAEACTRSMGLGAGVAAAEERITMGAGVVAIEESIAKGAGVAATEESITKGASVAAAKAEAAKSMHRSEGLYTGSFGRTMSSFNKHKYCQATARSAAYNREDVPTV